jgi:uncharacterized membrane protein YphA (DoxX/SURF4 family)
MPVGAVDLPRWKAVIGAIAAALMAILFFVSGAWKLVYLFEWSQFMGQFQVPSELKLPFTIVLGIGEMLGAALIIVPRFRRWGSILIGLLLIAFMAYIGMKYNVLAGKDCSCFPLVKRTVGPGFFIGDAVMLALTVLAGVWAPRPHGLRGALVILGVIAVFAGVSFGINVTHNTGLKAPDSITVDGKPYSLESGNVFLFFFDPECMYCFEAAQRMSKINWGDTKVIAIPTRVPRFAAGMLHDAGLQAPISSDSQLLRQTFKFADPPFGVALHNGRQKATVPNFDPSEPAKTLKQIGFIH